MDRLTTSVYLDIAGVTTFDPLVNTSSGGSGGEDGGGGGGTLLTSPDAVSLTLLLPLLLLMLTTIAGNVVVMVCVRVDKRLASSISSIYVFSLAGADAVVGLTVMAGMCVYTVFGFWPLGPLLCTIWVAFDFTCCTVSMMHLILIAYDRYEAVVHPIDYKTKRTAGNALVRAVAAWVVSFVAWLPAIVAFRVIAPGPENDCFFIPDKLYILVQSVVVYYSPIVVMLVFYVRCLAVLRDRYRKTVAAATGVGGGGDGPKLFLATDASTTTTTTTTTVAGSEAANKETEVNSGSAEGPGQRGASDPSAAVSQAKLGKQQQQLRSIRTLGVVMAMFLFCWLPFCLFWPITAYCPSCISAGAYEYSYWAAYLNSAINPFLYFLSNRDFRNAFMTMIGREQQ